jgi:hypothetical protein
MQGDGDHAPTVGLKTTQRWSGDESVWERERERGDKEAVERVCEGTGGVMLYPGDEHGAFFVRAHHGGRLDDEGQPAAPATAATAHHDKKDREKNEGTCGHGDERHQGVHLSAAEATVAYVTTKPTIASKTPATIPTYQYKNTHNDRQATGGAGSGETHGTVAARSMCVPENGARQKRTESNAPRCRQQIRIR